MRLHLLSVLALASPCFHGQALHLSCTGVGSPLVILEAGAGRGADDWAKVQPTVGKLTQVCSYDRHPGHCCDQVIDDLRSALREASFTPPYVFVGHSLGGLYVRRFADRFPDDVAGLVLVDSADEKQLTGIIAPGLKPELYRPGAMSDSEIHAFFQELGRANDGCGRRTRRRQRKEVRQRRFRRDPNGSILPAACSRSPRLYVFRKTFNRAHRRSSSCNAALLSGAKGATRRRPPNAADADEASFEEQQTSSGPEQRPLRAGGSAGCRNCCVSFRWPCVTRRGRSWYRQSCARAGARRAGHGESGA